MLGRIADLVAAVDPAAAALLLGAVETISAGIVRPATQLVERADALALLAGALSEDRLTELHRQGSNLSERDLVACARSAIDSYLDSDLSDTPR